MEKIKQIIPIEFPEAHKHWSLTGQFSVFCSLVWQENAERGFGPTPEFQWLCRHVPSPPPSPCSLGSLSQQAVDQLWGEKYIKQVPFFRKFLMGYLKPLKQ